MLVRESGVQPPALENYADAPLFNTKAVVHQTGVPAPTLRAWERRYGILTPRRGDNDYRLYSERDIATVAWLRERVEMGMTISQAIALLHSLEPSRRKPRRGRTGPLVASDVAEPATRSPATQAPPRFSLREMGETLLAQFVSLDEYAATRTIAQALAVYAIEDVSLDLVMPVMHEIGRLWAAGRVTPTVEHFATAIVRAQLDSLYRSASASTSGPVMVVGCAPGELHELGSLMLALFLRRAGYRVLYLGQNVEAESLLTTIRAVNPAAVLLSASMRSNAEALIDVAARVRENSPHGPLLFFGGQAFTQDADLATHVPGEYLNLSARNAVYEIRRRLSA